MARASTAPQPVVSVIATLVAPALVPQKALVLAWVEVNGRKECRWVES
ncbi:MAG: hypothetical protein NW220_18880 [Leptolyngbyaceae cyanobacterium bins.349]|nr:hypothetical protein [Leptolyngbyaceae cyanobacterium bins.349]